MSGISGFRIIKFRGRYWIFYHHVHSHPDGLGEFLVNSIPTDPEEYQKWLQTQRDSFTEWDLLLQKLLIIQPEDLLKLQPQPPPFRAAFDERLDDNAPPYHEAGFNGLHEGYVKWIYTIDLDREVFSINDNRHFSLNHIPRNEQWKTLHLDNTGDRILLPQLIPTGSAGILSLDPPSFTTFTKYETLQTRLVKAKCLDHLSPSQLTAPRLRWLLFNFIQRSEQRNLSVTLLSWQAQDLPFRKLAFFILCLATGGENLALVDLRRVRVPYDEGLCAGIVTGDEPEADTELASSLGVGYHMDGLPMGSAPEATKYWFEGALICLVPQLEYPGIMEKAIADAVDYGRNNCTKHSFNAVIISIEHFVLIKSFSDGTADHTELLPLMPITTQGSRYEDNAATDDEEGGGNAELMQTTPAPVVSTKRSFMALIQFFEATARETLQLTQPNERRLPVEICEMVLRNVSDMQTYNSCLKVSRRFRLICQQRPLVMEDVVFLEPLPIDPNSFIREDGKEDRQNSRPVSDFLAVEVSSGRQMKVVLHRHSLHRHSGRNGRDLTCLITAGSERDRKTYVSYSYITFQGLSLPAPGVKEAGMRSRRREALYYGSEGTPWESGFALCCIDTESDTRRFGNFWKNTTRALKCPVVETSEPEWTLPANTRYFFGTQPSLGEKGADFHYLYLRVKRPSKYWNNLWKNIIREAVDNLEHTDDRKILYLDCPGGEVIGADEPYVILAVGMAVRLFKWEQGFDDSVDDGARRKKSPYGILRELSPGKVLNILEKTDREKIEDFLLHAKMHKKKIKARLTEKCGIKWDKVREFNLHG